MAKTILSKKIRGRIAFVKSNSVTVVKKFGKKISAFIKKRPMRSFFILLGLLLLFLILGQLLQPKVSETISELPTKKVKVYSIGQSPKATFQAKIEKAGIVKIVAQTNGVVQGIGVTEGDAVSKGQQIIWLSSTYQGGNAPALQREIAQAQYQNVLNTYDQQKELIKKQREIANTTDENSDKMRDISKQALDETNALITDSQSYLDQYKQTPSADQGVINQLQAGLNQLREAARALDYSASGDNPPAKLSDSQKDIAVKQLDLQEKSLDLSKELSRLQLSLAYVNEQAMYPASPFFGVVERVYVHVGQSVSSGTILATISASDVHVTAVVMVPHNIAKIIQAGEPSELLVADKRVALLPYYVSTQATDGQLYSVLYEIPQEYQTDLTDGSFMTISVPVNHVETTSIDPFVPVDAVYQSQDSAFVLVVHNNIAQSKQVTLGNVYGNSVEVLKGITSGDQIVLDRNVIAGDPVRIE